MLPRLVLGAPRPIVCAALTAWLVASLTACGGSGGDTPPVTPPAADNAVTTVVASPTSLSVAANATATLAVTGQNKAGAVVSTATFTYATSGGHATVAGSGASATVMGVRAGVDTVLVTSGAVTARVPVTVTAQAGFATTLQAATPAVSVAQGGTYSLSFAATDGLGNPVAGRTPSFGVDQASVVSVSAAGVVTGLAQGSARVTARLDSGTAVVRVTVTPAGSLSFALLDTALAPGATVRVRGAGLSGAAVRVGGAGAAVAAASDTALTFTVPAAPFAPCVPAGATFPVQLTAGGRSGAAAVAAVEVPLAVALAPGQHAILPQAVATGCAVETPDAGGYVAMPYGIDADPGDAQVWAAPAPFAGRVQVAPVGVGPAALRALSRAALSRAATARAASVRAFLPRTVARTAGAPGGDVQGLELLPAWRQAVRAGRGTAGLRLSRAAGGAGSGGVAGGVYSSAPACPVPTAPGATMQLQTTRNAGGQAVKLGGTAEPWTLVAASANAQVFVDTSFTRALHADSTYVMQQVQAVLDAYEQTVLPSVTTYAGPLKDDDGNGRLIILLPNSTSAQAWAYPFAYARVDCGSFTAGEAIFVPAAAALARNGAAGGLLGVISIAAHETGHVAEVPTEAGNDGVSRGTEWSREGYAELARFLWANNGGGAFTANAGSFAGRAVAQAGNAAATTECLGYGGDPSRPMSRMFARNLNAVEYAGGCALLNYVMQRAVAAGQSPEAAVRKWLALPNRHQLAAIENGMLGTGSSPRDAATAAGEYLLSFYASGAVAGVSPWLTNTAYQVGAVLQANGLGLRVTTLAGGAGDQAVSLGMLDAQYVAYTAAGRTRVRLTAPDGRALGGGATPAGFALLRTR